MNGCCREGPSLACRISRRFVLPGDPCPGPHPKAVRRSDTAQRADLELVGARKVLPVNGKERSPVGRERPKSQVERRSAAHVETRRRLDGVEVFAPEAEQN